MRRVVWTASMVVITFFSLTPVVFAQRPAWTVAAGYQTVDDRQDRITLRGWNADAAVALTPWLWAIVEAGNATRVVGDVEFRQFAILGGGRASARIGPFTEFVQLVVGMARSGSTVFGESSADTNVALQPGGGVDVPIGRRFAARLQIDRRSILGGPFQADDRHDVRLGAAIVFRPN